MHVRLLVSLIFTSLICSPLTLAAPAASQSIRVSTKESEAKQAELKDLRGQIQQLQKELSANESNRNEAADALKESEQSISEANRVLNELAHERELTQNELAKLEADIARTRVNIRASQKRLGDLLKNHYKLGQLEAWRLLLNQKDPNQVTRDLTYYKHLARSQQVLANQLERQLNELNQLSEQIQQKNAELQEIARSKQQQREQLLDEQEQKKAVVTKLSKEISSQRNQIQKLAADEKRLTELTERLNALIKKQEAERARQLAKQQQEAKKRAEQLAKAKAEREARQAKQVQQAKAAGKPAPTPEPEPKEESGPVNEKLPDPALAGANFASLKGKLALPVKGEVIGRFGALRGEGGTWKGLMIKAANGQSVHAIASGRVVFADWLRGFGNLMIIDHGGGYMSLYGANESVLKRVGDSVKPGDVIATVGNSGGMAESGVYFEIRQNSRPLDPLQWAK
ncbi:peptidoglycan DD-metalloendopeptidase family protein [Chitinibacter bivalviorum]|uniref:Peptidoglycan DD-metalloendopeptidase family protein n=1 Tax=Chitinibacter bivalviorum TaxID=2739434 RepID=A0A7H9BEV3_9NEIS|nr:peptidoglycan DD-metalloendopeptidase family protein [Chitinibacter bivalviorum]QLG86942.1 peptidoglycan DD-metalloendopeptidase family protein [Chitinibacter bivalviorum]